MLKKIEQEKYIEPSFSNAFDKLILKVRNQYGEELFSKTETEESSKNQTVHLNLNTGYQSSQQVESVTPESNGTNQS